MIKIVILSSITLSCIFWFNTFESLPVDVNFIVVLRRSFFEEVLLSLRQIRILYGSDHDEIFLHEGPGMKGGGSGLMILFTAWRLGNVTLIDIPKIFEVQLSSSCQPEMYFLGTNYLLPRLVFN